MSRTIEYATINTGNACNSRCDGCMSRDVYNGVMRISDDFVKKVEEVVAAKSSVRVCTITGGEPTLTLKQTGDLLNVFESSITRMITNGWWGRNKKASDAICNVIRDNSLDQLFISHSAEHDRHIPWQDAVRAAECALERSDRLSVTYIHFPGAVNEIDKLVRKFHSMKRLYGKRFKLRFERWHRKERRYEARTRPLPLMAKRWCRQLTTPTIAIWADGSISRCTGLSVAEKDRCGRMREFFMLGNIFDDRAMPCGEPDAHDKIMATLNESYWKEHASFLLSTHDDGKRYHKCEACMMMVDMLAGQE